MPSIHAFGGVERLVVDLSRFLHGMGLAHSVVTLSRTIDLAGYADWPLKVIDLHAPRAPLGEAACLGNFLMRESGGPAPLLFDLKSAFYLGLRPVRRSMHLHLTDPPSLLPRDVSKHAFSVRRDAPAVHRDAALGMAIRGEAVHRLNRFGAHRFASIIVMTNRIRDEIQALYNIPVQVIRPGVSPPSAPPCPMPDEPQTLSLLTVSRLERSKRIDWILRAVSRLERTERLSARVNWTLDVVGDGGEAAALRELSEREGIAARTVFHGRLNDIDLENLYSKPSVFLMPAIQGYGLPALEALIRGRPVVLHRESGVSEIIDRRPWAEAFDGGEDALTKAIGRAIGHVLAGSLTLAEPPAVPTADEWARGIATACGWI